MYAVPYVIVIGPGRSGTTIAQALLNCCPHTLIRGENNNFFYSIYNAYSNLIRVDHRPAVSGPESPWFGYEFFNPEEFLRLMSDYARNTLSGRCSGAPPSPKPFVLGFKEIRFFHRINSAKYSTVPLLDVVPYLKFLTRLFPGVKFVYVDRDPLEIAESSWWSLFDRDQLVADINEFKHTILESGLDNIIRLPYLKIKDNDLDYLRDSLFRPLDLPFDKQRVASCLAKPLEHLKRSSSVDSRATLSQAHRSLMRPDEGHDPISPSSGVPGSVFLDFGANYFQGLKFFAGKLGMDKSWHVYSYEANPYIFEDANAVASDLSEQLGLAGLNLVNAAVAASSGVVSMACIKGEIDQSGEIIKEGDFGGSSIAPRSDKRFLTSLAHEQVEVRSVDILDIMAETVTRHPSARLCVKCDIEGAEYEVLDRLANSPYAKHIDLIFVEWHSRFFGDESRKMKDLELNIISRLESSGIIVHRHW